MPEQEPTAASIDPDVDVHVPYQRQELADAPGRVLSFVALGGACGSLARYAVSLLQPSTSTAFPWPTFAVNVSGCFLIGCLMGWLEHHRAVQPWARPLLGSGFLGGFTTFSAYTVEGQQLLVHSRALLALGYLLATVVAALAAAGLGLSMIRVTTGGIGRRSGPK